MSIFLTKCLNHNIHHNGHFRLPSEFDISGDALFDGHENNLFVVVVRFCDGHFLEDQDMWNMSGIFRDVRLLSLPGPLRIIDFSWTADQVDDNSVMENTSLLVGARVELGNLGEIRDALNGDYYIDFTLFAEGIMTDSTCNNFRNSSGGGAFNLVSQTTQSEPVFNFTFDGAKRKPVASALVPITRDHCEDSWCYQNGNITRPSGLTVQPPNLRVLDFEACMLVKRTQRWSPEKPYIYTLVISLQDSKRKEFIQIESCRVGFRCVQILSGLLRIDRQPILVKGVNLHEHDPVVGTSL